MSEPGTAPNKAEIIEMVDETLHGLELEPDEASEILSFANQEIPHLQTPETSYFVLGSYRDPFIRQVRIVQNELDKRIGTYPFLMGDLREIDIDRLPTFRIRFHILAAHANYIVGVYEQDAGGEITELGKISSTPYFECSYVFPRDYTWMTRQKLETPEDVFAAAVNIHFNDDIEPDTIDEELEALVAAARQNRINVNLEDILHRIEERDSAEEEAVSYSWVQLNEFRLFELHNQCLPWTTPEGLRTAVEKIP
jgi:hypothetical protein